MYTRVNIIKLLKEGMQHRLLRLKIRLNEREREREKRPKNVRDRMPDQGYQGQ